MMRKLLIPFLVTLCIALPFGARAQAIYSDDALAHPVHAAHGMVASQEAIATRVGVKILENGGNAVDAAVAVGFALAVTLPRAGNIGGGGFMLIHLADPHQDVAIDYREMAPGNAYRDMFLDADGNADPTLSRFHGRAVGVPGTVAGLTLALEKYGTMPLAEVMQPAIRLASEGIKVSADLAASLTALHERLARWPSTEKIFYKADGSPYQPGEKLRQTDLADSLSAIAEKGAAAFYHGAIGERVVAEVERQGGLMTMDDLNNYKAIVRKPVRGTYRGFEIESMPPPSSGGVHIIEILNILEGYPIGYLGHNTAQTIHLMAEAMKLAYADRSEYLGDSDFVDVPVAALTSKHYAAEQRARIDRFHATPSTAIAAGKPLLYESNETTHFSVVDRFGNAVANTYTLNFSYGAGFVADGTGILLNDEMDDFSAKPGVPNAYGLIGGDANAVAPHKRPLSSMSPTIVLKDGNAFLVTGSPGGSRIITTVLQVIMNVIDHGMNIAEATNAVRIHDQWLPDELRIEKGLNDDTIRLLTGMGYKVVQKAAMGSVQSVMVTGDGLDGWSDLRSPGALTLGY